MGGGGPLDRPEQPGGGGGGGAIGGGGGGGGPILLLAGWLIAWGTCACGAGRVGVGATTGGDLLFEGVGGTPRAPGGGGGGGAIPVVAILCAAG